MHTLFRIQYFLNQHQQAMLVFCALLRRVCVYFPPGATLWQLREALEKNREAGAKAYVQISNHSQIPPRQGNSRITNTTRAQGGPAETGKHKSDGTVSRRRCRSDVCGILRCLVHSALSCVTASRSSSLYVDAPLPTMPLSFLEVQTKGAQACKASKAHEDLHRV